MTPRPEMPLADFFRDVFKPAKLNAGARWHGMFHTAINRLERYLGRVPTLADLTDENLAAWMRAGRAAGLAISTVNRRAKQLAALWRFAKRKRLLPHDAALDPEYFREPRRLPQAWSIEQFELIIRSARPVATNGHKPHDQAAPAKPEPPEHAEAAPLPPADVPPEVEAPYVAAESGPRIDKRRRTDTPRDRLLIAFAKRPEGETASGLRML